ncbi:hypothetical protein A3K69_04260 [Candidatus Bathyarchaeota archaeon RBG_16_57_9]|nr:MAG: hypothetical protein A3K69_04260 [Candidatus Bathyarchaeota archaeon RBG_16_57_9]
MEAPGAEEFLDSISSAVKAILFQQPLRLEVKGKLVTLPAKGSAVVVGDLHGDIESLEHILGDSGFEERVMEGEDLHLLCFGDYVDRGPGQVQVLYRLLRLLGSYPGRVVLLRGNHEGPADVPFQPHDFPLVLRDSYGSEATGVYREFRTLCDELYTAAILPGRALFVHGGVPTGVTGPRDLAYAHMEHPYRGNLVEALWNDPTDEPGVYPSPRGIGKLVGPDVTEAALEKLGVSTLVRSHQSCPDGWGRVGRTLTVFSCRLPQYGNRRGAYLDLPLGGDAPVDLGGCVRVF